MYICSTLFSTYFRCYGPWKYILSPDTKYEMVGKQYLGTASALSRHNVKWHHCVGHDVKW
jgi:hypothetical protein